MPTSRKIHKATTVSVIFSVGPTVTHFYAIVSVCHLVRRLYRHHSRHDG